MSSPYNPQSNNPTPESFKSKGSIEFAQNEENTPNEADLKFKGENMEDYFEKYYKKISRC